MHLSKKLNGVSASDVKRRVEVSILLLSLVGFASMASIYLLFI